MKQGTTVLGALVIAAALAGCASSLPEGMSSPSGSPAGTPVSSGAPQTTSTPPSDAPSLASTAPQPNPTKIPPPEPTAEREVACEASERAFAYLPQVGPLKIRDDWTTNRVPTGEELSLYLDARRDSLPLSTAEPWLQIMSRYWSSTITIFGAAASGNQRDLRRAVEMATPQIFQVVGPSETEIVNPWEDLALLDDACAEVGVETTFSRGPFGGDLLKP